MRKTTIFVALLVVACFSIAGAQETYFGKNKVQYRNFDWNFIQTDHFDIHFYDNEYDLAKFAAEELEKAYTVVTRQLKHFAARRIPVFIYSSHNDFQQTNIIWDILSEGTQGFTEVLKNRIVVHFMGSYEEFRHLLHHELTHAVVYDLLYGQFFKSVLTANRLFQQPLWLAEGFAEYSSNGGWSGEADMMVRDATIQDYLRPPDYMGFMAYTEGYALVKYIADTYGEEKIGEIFHRGKALTTIDKALESTIGIKSKELYEHFAKEMKKRYWPDISLREEPKDFARQLTNHAEDPSNYNEKPVFSPKGNMLAMFTDRNGYAEIHLISAIDGKRVARLVKGERSADLESLRWYTSGMSFSPDAEQLVFVSKANGEDALNFLKIKNKKIYLRKKFGLKSIISPAWSPDGRQVVFTALAGPERNLYLYTLDTDSLRQLTNDRYDDKDVAWFPDSRRIVFSSDRYHPAEYGGGRQGEFTYGAYNLHEMDLATGAITPIQVGSGQNVEPAVSPDGEKIAFVSHRNGIDNLYVYYIDSARVIPVTNVLTTVNSPTWSPDSKMLAFSTFIKGGYDIYLLKEIIPKGKNDRLPLTDFALGKYDSEWEWARGDRGFVHITADADKQQPLPPVNDPDFPADGVEASTVWGVDADAADDLDTSPVGEDLETAIADVESPIDSALTGETGMPVDSTAVAEADSAATGATDTLPADAETARGTIDGADEDEVYVYTAPVDETVFAPEGEVTAEGETAVYAESEPIDSLSADSLDNTLPNGEYRVRDYKTKFTPDIIGGGLQYDSFFGFRGQTTFLFSDYLGDHQILIATDLVNTIDQSNIQVFYFYNKQRVDFGIGLFHTKNYYVDANDELFSDRFYGVMGSIIWPRSTFTRFELNAATYLIDRKYYDNVFLDSRNVRITTAALSWIHDTVLWGITGPVNGRRYKITIEAATPVFGSKSLNYYAAELDYRRYLYLGSSFSVALRGSGGFSGGSSPKNYFLGGNTNRIGTISVESDVYEVENLYFSSVITPLRGYDYYDLAGTRYAVTNMELHFPLIDYFLMRYPLRLGLSRITGALFMDMGATWRDGDTFKGATSQGGSRLLGIKTGFGFGMRANLGFLVLRYDMAWRTNFQSVDAHTKHYFSLGADF